MAYIPYEFISHVRRVKSVYKKYARDALIKHDYRHDQLIAQSLVRAEFEKNRNIRDPLLAKQLVKKAEEDINLEIMLTEQKIWPDSPNGVAADRHKNDQPADWVLDYWHPLEKAQYPKYFARRELMKQEFVAWYDRTYGKPTKLEDMDD